MFNATRIYTQIIHTWNIWENNCHLYISMQIFGVTYTDFRIIPFTSGRLFVRFDPFHCRWFCLAVWPPSTPYNYKTSTCFPKDFIYSFIHFNVWLSFAIFAHIHTVHICGCFYRIWQPEHFGLFFFIVWTHKQMNIIL